MPMTINFGGMMIPNLGKDKYKYTAFKEGVEIPNQSGPSLKVINIKQKLDAAWTFATKRAAGKSECNAYFKALRKKLSLGDVLELKITLHCLWPKADNPTFEDFLKLPYGNTAGQDIGINPYFLLEEGQQPNRLGCLLIHELAHVAGASTYTEGAGAHDAEAALPKCLCDKFYSKDILGRIERMPLPAYGGSRLV